MSELRETAIAGCFTIRARHLADTRGEFVKTYQRSFFEKHGLESDFQEQYYSVSYRNVLRGLHFQVPPHDHVKLVTCLQGEVMDVVVDVRHGSPTFGQHCIIELSPDGEDQVYLARGLAHGFYVRTDTATMLYDVTSEYAPEHDAGIRWNSVEIPWPVDEPILSPRDAGFQGIEEFSTPFHYAA